MRREGEGFTQRDREEKCENDRKRLFKIFIIYYEFNVKRRCALTSDSNISIFIS